jgi:hypothetical protein
LKYTDNCWVLVAHACNPSYSEGRDQEYCSLKPAQANSFRDSISKKALGVFQVVEHLWSNHETLSSNPSIHIHIQVIVANHS